MLSFLAAHKSLPRKDRTAENPITYTDGTMQEFHAKGDAYAITHTIPSAKAFSNPPPHIHLYQTESFDIKKGRGVWSMPRHADPRFHALLVDAADPDPEARKVQIPVGVYHCFRNISEDEPLVVDVRLDEENLIVEEQFFRNFFGYLDDCIINKTEPSIFQLMRFLHAFDCPVAVPVPAFVPDWMAVGISRGVCTLLGPVIGEGLLGYKATYPEYYAASEKTQ